MNRSFIASDENSNRFHTKRTRTTTPVPHRQPLQPLTSSFNSLSSTTDDLNPLQLGYYAPEIYENLFNSECSFLANPEYMNFHTDINYKMRAILIDWLVSVHLKFKFSPETLYLTVNIIDRYLEKKKIKKQFLQLAGVSAFLIASKYEDISPPAISDLVYVTDKAYTKEQIVEMEEDILVTIEYQLVVPSSWRFFERLSKITQMEETDIHFGRFLLELCLVEYHMLRYRPSVIAASAVYLTRKMFKVEPAWTQNLQRISRVDENQLRDCSRDILVVFQAASIHTLTGVKDKFSRKEYLEVAKIRTS
ncbi:unnamed protein product [Blepharisma stoltei]|uniref:Cyclin N-terminal domain-containing protein n=1 Tax=Blepharisma stoltei TaxID=1481888 RepID=A0AAU9JLS4_9CILI|nr:unnamed protein product [Blepharisma stoltei]